MTAFDTTSNSSSASFSDSWAAVVLQPSATDQYAKGFQRSAQKRYFEFIVNNTGGDASVLWLGFRTYFGAGGNGFGFSPLGGRVNFLQETGLQAGTTLTGGGFGFSYTASDILMFAANFAGDGKDINGATVAATTSDGLGHPLYPVIWNWGKNGTWNAANLISWDWPSGGYPKHGKPATFRQATPASAASVTLKVATNSFAFSLPSGYVPWGDGPESSTSLSGSDDATVNWDNTKKSASMSLSGSNLYAVEIGAVAVGRDFVYSTVLPTTGKRYIEFTAHISDSTTFCNVGGFPWAYGLVEANIASITSTATEATAAIVLQSEGIGIQVFQRTVNIGGSITNVITYDANQTTPTCGMMVDFDNKKMWFVNPNAPGGTSKTPWCGDKTANSAFGYSFGATSSTDGISITDSAVGMRIAASIRKNYTHAPTQIFFKMNPTGPFESYPLLPGATSMNGGREVIAHAGDYWDVANNPPSMTYGAAELVVKSRSAPALAQGRDIKSSGKKYFEIYKESDAGNGSASLDFCVGVRRQDATTVTAATNITGLVDEGLFFYNRGTSGNCARYGVTLTWTATESVTTGGAGMARWQGIAVDFDSGKIWCGTWNKVQHRMEFGTASDPTAGTGAHMTFTASTTMRIAVVWGSSGAVNDRVVMVADSNNLIGLPPGFTPWNPPASSLTATPSASVAGAAGRVLWPYGVQT